MTTETPAYSREFVYATISMDDYIRRFRDAERVAGYCRECSNYGNRSGCPPFDYSIEDELRRYREVLLVAARVSPEEKHLPIETGMRCLTAARLELEHQVRSLETVLDGRAMGLELVRPSLEAWGFDVNRTTEELMQLPIRWSVDGLTPEYFTLVCGFFHNSTPETALATLQEIQNK